MRRNNPGKSDPHPRTRSQQLELELFPSTPRSPSPPHSPHPIHPTHPSKTAIAQPQQPHPVPFSHDPQALLLSLTSTAVTLTRNLGFIELARKLRIIWNPRLTSTAGRAFHQFHRIELNPLLLQLSTNELDRILKHELAHLLAHAAHPRKRIASHGREWRAACIALGIPNESSRHTLPLPTRSITPKYFYRCPHCFDTISRVRPFRRTSIYACSHCCKKFNHGKFSKKFQFVRIASPI